MKLNDLINGNERSVEHKMFLSNREDFLPVTFVEVEKCDRLGLNS